MIYIVAGYTVRYSERDEWLVKYFNTEEEAEAYVDLCENAQNQIIEHAKENEIDLEKLKGSDVKVMRKCPLFRVKRIKSSLEAVSVYDENQAVLYEGDTPYYWIYEVEKGDVSETTQETTQ